MLNQGWTYEERVPKSFRGWSILAYYTHRYRHSDEDAWRARILSGQVTLEGEQVDCEQLLQTGQRLCYQRPPWEEPDVPLDFSVLYEDNDVMAVAKPSGLPVMPAGGFLQNTLWWQIQQHYPTETPIPIHRLGRGTSGVLLLARTPEARASLSQQMRQSTEGTKLMHKQYRALVGEWPLEDTFVLDHPIGKVEHPILGHLYAATPSGQHAYSCGRVLARRPGETLLEVTIHTGRPHQIRIHLATAGAPLLGDPLYQAGGGFAWVEDERAPVPGDCGYFLHACRVSFVHPRTLQRVEIFCPPPSVLAWEAVELCESI
ncbi:MAG: RluA family pseudouridine synthase [Myxococcales bacterium]|nr:RluA family pseudouridine synthase [Myxococcales bacterium]